MPLKPNSNDLDFLAEQGYTAVPDGLSDLPILKEKIKAQSFSYQQKRYLAFFTLLIGVFLGFTIFFGLYEHSLNTVTAVIKNTFVNTVPEQQLTIHEPNAPSEIVSENFVKPVPTAPISPEEIEAPNELPAVEALPSVQMPELPAAGLTEQKLKFMVNSPIFYIQNLKVTNYTTLYFRKNKFMPTTGLTANYGSEAESHLPREAPETWLHEKLADALKDYNRGQFMPCILALDEVATHNEEDLNCDFYRGMSWYHMKNFAKAISFLDACIVSNNNAFLQEAMFYKALSLKELGNTVDSKKLLHQIVEEGEFYAEKAKIQLMKQE